MKILLLYKGLLKPYEADTYYRAYIEQYLGNIQFDIARLPNPTGSKKNVSASEMREWADMASSTLNQYDYVLIADALWFKTLCKVPKAETTLGMLYNSPNFTSKVFYVPSQYIYQVDIGKAYTAFQSVLKGITLDYNGKSTIIEPDIHNEYYPNTYSDIKTSLDKLMTEPMLYCDIEAKSLKVTEAGIYTIGFATDKHNGIAFPVDIHSEPEKIRDLLRDFFKNYQGKLVFHKANYDVAVLNYTLYQTGLDDVKGQLEGLNIFFRDNRIEDTLIITYLATNSCSGNILGLKELAQPYAGDWAVEVKDVTKVPLDKLLRYNLVDCLSTAYVYETYYPKMVADEQEDLYKSFMLPTLKTNIRCQLNGLPIDLSLVQKFKEDLNQEKQGLLNQLRNTQVILNAEQRIVERITEKRNSKLKTKITTIEDNYREINFNSSDDLIILVHEVMQLPVIETTEGGKSSLGKSVLKDLINHTNNEEYKLVLNCIAELKDIEKIESAFIPAFEASHKVKKLNRLLGYFNLAGTVSGRLSSSSINLQQLPSTGSRFAKPTKKIFTSNNEYLFVGIDFASLILGE